MVHNFQIGGTGTAPSPSRGRRSSALCPSHRVAILAACARVVLGGVAALGGCTLVAEFDRIRLLPAAVAVQDDDAGQGSGDIDGGTSSVVTRPDSLGLDAGEELSPDGGAEQAGAPEAGRGASGDADVPDAGVSDAG